MIKVTIGLERAAETPELLGPPPHGLLFNQASVDRKFRLAHLLLDGAAPGSLIKLFSPQHGLFSEQQDNMIESGHGRDSALGIPIHSLYSETRAPTPAMLDGLKTLVIDLQDVGTRVYTYAWTLLLALEACSRAGVRVLVLDRPNPVGGHVVEGPILDPAFASFVGLHAIPMRHALTLGELARLFDAELAIGADLHVVPMTGWSRYDTFSDTGRTWVPPSPNLPRPESALVYPGQVLLEGTTLSEGRGTTTPFEICGAPEIDPYRLAADLGDLRRFGLAARPVRFVPTFQKHAQRSCGGVFLHVIHEESVRSMEVTARILALARDQCPGRPLWTMPPYEYETEKMPIDILFGSSVLREAVDGGAGFVDLAALLTVDSATWWDRVRPHLLYPREPDAVQEEGRSGR